MAESTLQEKYDALVARNLETCREIAILTDQNYELERRIDVSDWNERIEKAKKAVTTAILRDLLSPWLEGERMVEAFEAFAEALKNPEKEDRK